MDKIPVETYLPELIELTRLYDLPLEGVIVVPNILEWCRGRGVVADNPVRAGKLIRNRETKQYLVLLARI